MVSLYQNNQKSQVFFVIFKRSPRACRGSGAVVVVEVVVGSEDLWCFCAGFVTFSGVLARQRLVVQELDDLILRLGTGIRHHRLHLDGLLICNPTNA